MECIFCDHPIPISRTAQQLVQIIHMAFVSWSHIEDVPHCREHLNRRARKVAECMHCFRLCMRLEKVNELLQQSDWCVCVCVWKDCTLE